MTEPKKPGRPKTPPERKAGEVRVSFKGDTAYVARYYEREGDEVAKRVLKAHVDVVEPEKEDGIDNS